MGLSEQIQCNTTLFSNEDLMPSVLLETAFYILIRFDNIPTIWLPSLTTETNNKYDQLWHIKYSNVKVKILYASNLNKK